MNAKNLPMKFAVVATLVALSLYGVFATKLKLGIDLRGGHSLIFEIMTDEVEAQHLEGQLQALNALWEKATDDKAKQDIQARKEIIQQRIENLRGGGGDRSDLAEQIIAHLKERIDPGGLSNLEFRPLGRTRIEIRMPAGDPASKQAKRVYDDALEKLDGGNLHRSDLWLVADSRGSQRLERICALSGFDPNRGLSWSDPNLALPNSDPNRADLLVAYAQTVDQAVQAKADVGRLEDLLEGSSATSQPQDKQKELADQIAQAKETLDDAQTRSERLYALLLNGNVSRARLTNILRNYVSQKELKRDPKEQKELQRRLEEFEIGLETLLSEYAHRGADIERVVKAYQDWALVRGRLDDPSDLIRLVRNAGVLEFRIAPHMPTRNVPADQNPDRLTTDDVRRYVEVLQDPTEGPEALRQRNDRFLWFPVHSNEERMEGLVTADAGGRTYVLLYNQLGSMMLQKRGTEGWTLTGANPSMDENGRPAVAFEFDERGANAFGDLTGGNINRPMAILLDDEVYSAPNIKSRITSRGQITGQFRQQDVVQLARTLQAGSLPARLNPEPVAQNTFGAAFGEENLQSAIRAGLWSAAVILGFMLVYYLLAGVIANAALAMNLLLVIGSMALFDAVFTLPGIAGVILVIGMGVDANVLIYERLREEQAKGLSLRMALKNAYERAFSAIFDSNITTLITCAILGWVGTEEVRGFAITLALGVAFNLFSAVYVTRWVFQLLLELGWANRPFRMLRIIGVPKVDWMAKRYYFWVFSLATLVLGLGSLIWQGRDILGIEFTKGTEAVVTLKDDALLDGKLPNDGLVRELFSGKAKGHDVLSSTANVVKVETGRVSMFLRDHDTDGDGKITRDEWAAQRLSGDYFNQIDAQGNRDGVLTADVLEKYLPARSYKINTSETSVPLIQDVAAAAFGDALVQRQRIDFDLLHGPGDANTPLKVDLAADGRTTITKALAEKVDPRYRKEMLDAEGGVLLVLRLQTPATRTEVVQRIGDMRLQPDFAKQTQNRAEVVGLGSPRGDQYSEMAIFVMPTDPAIAARPRDWSEFSQQELQLTTEALHRQEAMVATNFDPAVAGQAKQLAVVAMVLAWAAIIVYLWVRFGTARWGVAAVVCLIHDVVIMLGMVAISGWLSTTWLGRVLMVDSFKLDMTMVAALLTIIGFSTNDTIVVFDRIRENRGRLNVVSPQIINASVNQTLSRTLLTNATVFVVVFIMYVWGGQGIHAFNYAMLAGVFFGTYSSIAIAAPILLGFKGLVHAHGTGPVPEGAPKA